MDEFYTAHRIPRLEQYVPEALNNTEPFPTEVEALQLRALCKIADALTRIEQKMKG